MIRITVAYPHTEGARFDHDYYQTRHGDLIRETLGASGLQRLEIDRVLSDGAGKVAPTVAAAHMFFLDIDAFKMAMKVGGKALADDLRNYTDIQPQVLISQTL